jgi:type II secretory pathway component HofQ
MKYVLILLLIFSGCRSAQVTAKKCQFKNYYDRLVDDRKVREENKTTSKVLTISAKDMPLYSFLRWIADQSDVSVICDRSLDDSPITIDVINTPLTDILSAIARRLNVDLTQQGNLFYMGALKPEDRGVLVRKVRRLGADDLQKTVQVLLSDMGRVASYSDGLLVVGDRVRVLQRIHSMLDQVEASQSNTWIVQIHIISTNEGFSRELGFKTETSLELASAFAQGSK